MADNNKNLSYEELRKEVIKQYRVLYKDALAMDICKVPKDIRIRMLEDPEYIAETKAIKAHLFVEQLETLDNVLAENYNHSDKGTDVSGVILKALEMKQKLLLEEKFDFQSEDMVSKEYVCKPQATIGNYSFRVLSVDTAGIDYPHKFIMIATNDKDSSIAYTAFYDDGYDGLVDLQEFLLSFGGWQHITEQ